MKSVLMVLKDLPRGGVEEVFYSISSGLLKQQVSCDLVVISSSIEAYEIERFSNICRNVYLLKGGGFGKIISVVSLLRHGSYMATISAKEKANLLVVVAGLISFILFFVKPKLILTRHVSIHKNISGSDSSILTPLLYFFYRFFPTCVVTCSKLLAKEVEVFYGGKRCHAIYNPVLGNSFLEKSALKPSVLLNDYASDTERKILFVGRLTKQKGCDILIEACIHIKASNIHLFIVGDGPDNDALKKQSEAVLEANQGIKITFLGMQSNVISIMKQADLFVMPSRWEGLPTVLIEALGVGMPVISTDCFSGPREIIPSEFHDACLVEVGDVISLANKINAVDYSRYNVTSFKREEFSDGACIDRYKNILGFE